MLKSQIVREIFERQNPDVRTRQAVALFLPDVREPEREEHVLAQRLLLKVVVVLGKEFVDDRLVDVLALPVPHVLLAFEVPKCRDALLDLLLRRDERVAVLFPRGDAGVIGVLGGHRRRNFTGWRTAWNGGAPSPGQRVDQSRPSHATRNPEKSQTSAGRAALARRGMRPECGGDDGRSRMGWIVCPASERS